VASTGLRLSVDANNLTKVVHGAQLIAWRTIPIPDFKTVAQVEDNARTLEFDPLSDEQRQQIDELAGQYHLITA